MPELPIPLKVLHSVKKGASSFRGVPPFSFLFEALDDAVVVASRMNTG